MCRLDIYCFLGGCYSPCDAPASLAFNPGIQWAGKLESHLVLSKTGTSLWWQHIDFSDPALSILAVYCHTISSRRPPIRAPCFKDWDQLASWDVW